MTEKKSGAFQSGHGDQYDDGTPSPKRSRYDSTTEIMSDSSSEEDSVHITVPQTQFEIEINSHHDAGSLGEEEIQARDLAGPAFSVIEEQDVPHLEGTNGGQSGGPSLSAIGRALLQMQPSQSSILISSSASPEQPVSSNGMGKKPHGSGTFTVPHSPHHGHAPHHGITVPHLTTVSAAPLYVMIPTSGDAGAELVHAMQASGRPIAPKIHAIDDSLRKDREQIRKATHNEVERRRRDRINELIKTLAQLVPGCQKKDANTGSVIGYVYSKGTVLDKTVEYLKELLMQNEQLSHSAKLAEKSASSISALQSQVAVLEKENSYLKSQLMQFEATNNLSTGLGPTRPVMASPLANPLAHILLQQCAQGSYIPSSSASTHANTTQQLLASLAHNLTSSNTSLLSSLAQHVNTPIPASSVLAMPQLSSNHLPPTTANVAPQIPQQLGGVINGVQNASQNTPLINLLLQSLASLASVNPPQAAAIPRITLPHFHHQAAVNQSNLSAAAAATLLNTLLVANMLGGGAPSNHNETGSGCIGTSVLNTVDQVNTDKK